MKQRKAPSTKSPASSSATPTTAELASLAAALATETGTETPESLARDALAIWEAAHVLLTKPPSPAPAEPSPQTLPQPKCYPVTLDEFLRLMLPKLTGRTGVKYNLFRTYLAYRLRNPTPPAMTWADDCKPDNPIPFDCLNPRIVPGTFEPYRIGKPNPPQSREPTKEDVDQRIALWRAKPIPDPQSFHYHAKAFRNWYEEHHANEVSAVRRDAGAKSLAKRQTKKAHATNAKPDKRRGARPPIAQLRQALTG